MSANHYPSTEIPCEFCGAADTDPIECDGADAHGVVAELRKCLTDRSHRFWVTRDADADEMALRDEMNA